MKTRRKKYTFVSPLKSPAREEKKCKNDYMREYMKKRRQRIKANPIEYENSKKLERERWHRRKALQSYTKNANLDELKEKRRIYMRKYREECRRKQQMSARRITLISDTCENNVSVSRQQKAGRKKVLRNRSKTVYEFNKAKKQNIKLKNDNRILQRKVWRYEKRLRKFESNKTKICITTVDNQLKNRFLSKGAIRKILILHEALKLQIKTGLQNIRDWNVKKNFFKVLNGNVLREYKLITACKDFLPPKRLRRSHTDTDKSNILSAVKIKSKILKNAVYEFFLRDDVSSIVPGKNATITKNKVKEQKRRLANTLVELHKKFNKETPYSISFSSFCRLRPFFVIIPSVTSRDTCLCVTHENIQLFTTSLYYNKVISSKTTSKVIKTICCDSKNENCLLRQCTKCKYKVLEYLPFNRKNNLSRKMWLTEKTERISGKTNKPIIVQRTVKKVITQSIEESIKRFNNLLQIFMSHCARIYHQYRAFQSLKSNISDTDIILHIDFAENYSCKYSNEPQSVHFGASREQVTLHTGILYTANETKSFCTLSESLKHDSAAIIAHLIPILTSYLLGNSRLSNLHIISDSPSTQYRNKNTFFLMVTYLPKIFKQIQTITYNFTEAGHGKGGPDGVGSAIKQAADRAVANGADVSNLNEMFQVLKSGIKNVYLHIVNPKDIHIISQISCEHLKPFKGTMSVHQWTWKKSKKTVIYFNSMSCYDCPRGEQCVHYSVGDPWLIKSTTGKTNNTINKRKKSNV